MSDNVTVIKPLEGPMRGSTRVPGDKSISHRAVLFSAMAEGTSRVSGVLDSADVRSSIGAVRALGAQVSLEKQADGSLAGGITGWGAAGPSQPAEPVDCGNSGTTVRLLMGILAPWGIQVTLTGDSSLCKRPMRRITAPLMKMGARFLPEGRETLPITVHGGGLRPLTYDAPMASAQLKTAVLLAGMYASGTTTVNEPAPSRNHTELMLPEYGVATTAGACTASVTGPAQPQAGEVLVPGDPSSAAFLACAAVLRPESSIQIEDVSLNTARIGFVRTLERMGAQVSVAHAGAAGKEPYGIIEACYTPDLRGCEVPADKIAGIIDEVPVLVLVAARVPSSGGASCEGNRPSCRYNGWSGQAGRGRMVRRRRPLHRGSARPAGPRGARVRLARRPSPCHDLVARRPDRQGPRQHQGFRGRARQLPRLPGRYRKACTMIIAIDGPSGAGKSTVSKAVARRLGFSCLDTGAMYRSIAWQALQDGVSLEDGEALGRIADTHEIGFSHEPGDPFPRRVSIAGVDVTDAIRTAEIDRSVSAVAAAPAVRQALVAQQQRIGRAGNYVVEGRDIGTAVFPEAELKVFLTASAAERAHRRVAQNERRGVGSTDYAEVLADIERRDAIDSSRDTSPLKPATDAVQMDSTGRTIEQVIERICALAQEKGVHA